MEKRREKDTRGGLEGGIGGILRGLGDLVEKLSDLENQGELSKTGTLRGPGAPGQVRGIYGFTVKVGPGAPGGPRMEVAPFGNLRRDATSGRTEVQEVREPMVDVFDEEKYLLVLAELPGTSKEDVHIELVDDVLTIAAERGDKKYRKEVLLPRSVPKDKMQVNCNNGVLEIRWVK